MTTIVKRPSGSRVGALVGEPDAHGPSAPSMPAVLVPSMRVALELIEDMVLVFKNEGSPELDKLADLHSLSYQLFTVAGAMHLRVFARAAFTFCAMLDRMRIGHRWDGPSVAVFIEAFRRLHAANDDSPLAGKIVEGLKRVAERADPYIFNG